MTETVSSKNKLASDRSSFDRSFPLLSRFRNFILPGLVGFTIAFVGLVAIGVRGTIQDVYLELAQRRASVLAAALDRSTPEEWRALLSSDSIRDFYNTPQGSKLAQEIMKEARELEAGKLRIYTRNGQVLFDARPSLVGEIAEKQTIDRVVGSNDPVLLEGGIGDAEYYRLFVPLRVGDHVPGVIVEMDEPSGYLNRVVFENIFLPISVTSLLLGVMIVFSYFLVWQAQRHIDKRTATLVALRRQLEHFVSQRTVTAVGRTTIGEEPRASRVSCSLLYVDVRDFSSFAEKTAPEDVATFLNRVVNIITDEVQRHGGDVDKLIGDGALARFEGANRQRRAISAGQSILNQLAGSELPRGVGIGVYDGDVVVTVIGSGERRDYTVVGDSVNISARLCSCARRGQLVADEVTITFLASDRATQFGPIEEIMVKGRTSPLKVRRWMVA